MKRWMILGYGVLCYAIGMGAIVYMMGWLINIGVPRSMDTPPEMPFATALAINVLLFIGFGVQHSVMARPGFKKWLTLFMPASCERPTYVLCSGIALVGMMFLWQPLGIEIWNVDHPVLRNALYSVYLLGWLILVGSTFALNHFDLFGLRQAWFGFRGQAYRPLTFRVPLPYRYVRHPLYVGWITLAWATPTMTLAHFAFALATTTYILIAIRYEERDLVDMLGKDYVAYRKRTSMLVPFLNRSRAAEKATDLAAE